MTTEQSVEDLLRTLAPQVLGALVRRYGSFDHAEDAVQEALLAASRQWPQQEMPQNPRGWLIRVASRRLIDTLRSETARKRREERTAAMELPSPQDLATPLERGLPREDDTLHLLFMCCHPILPRPAQVALTLRAVGGLTTAEIARAHLVPEPTMAQRISRAKTKIRDLDVGLEMPPDEKREERLQSVLQVLYLIFNEGYTSSAGLHLQRIPLADEAIRLTRELHRLVGDAPEVTGLLALMLLTHARRRARTGPNGELIPLEEQDRALWDQALIAEGIGLVEGTVTGGVVGPYLLQAAIAAVHAEAKSAEETDWLQIYGLYILLDRMTDNPMVTLARAVALAKARHPREGLKLVDRIADDDRVAQHHRWYAVRGHLLEMIGDLPDAEEAFREAAARTTNLPEQRYLHTKADAVRRGEPSTTVD